MFKYVIVTREDHAGTAEATVANTFHDDRIVNKGADFLALNAVRHHAWARVPASAVILSATLRPLVWVWRTGNGEWGYALSRAFCDQPDAQKVRIFYRSEGLTEAPSSW